MTGLKENFSQNHWNLIIDVLNNGRRVSWFELAQKYNIRPEGTYSQRRKSANDIWRRFTRITNKSNIDLVTIKQTLNRDGEVVFETKKLKEEVLDIDPSILEGKKIKKITVNPYGKPWVTYENKAEQESLNKEDILEAVKNFLEGDKTLRQKQINQNELFPFTENLLLVYTSDKHIGAKVEENSIYQNEYNAEVIHNRLQKIATSIISRGNMEELVIFDLGDALDGFNSQTTRGGHTLSQNMNNKEQFETYLSVHAKFFETIFNAGNTYGKVKYICAANNNHGGDFDYMAMSAFKMYLERVYPFIEVVVTDKFINHLEVGSGDNKHTIIYTHGKDDKDMKHGLPLQLNDKVENYINNYIDYHRIDTRNPIHFIKGDLHQSASQYAKRFRYKNVGSIFGSSKWIHTNFGNTKPICDMEILERNSINEIRLFL